MIIPCPGFTNPIFTISEEDLLRLILINKNEEIKAILERTKEEGMRRFEETRKEFRRANNTCK